jgi:DNA-binding NarL/FixJ family response regulator
MSSPSVASLAALYVGGHALTRDVMRMALAPGGIRMSTAVSIPDALERIESEGPFQVALVDDDGLGERLAIEAVETLQKQAGCRVVVLSASRSPVFPADAVRAGASGYLSKEIGAEELRHAILRIAEGHMVLDPMVTRTLLGILGPDGAEPSTNGSSAEGPHLTPVERRVLVLVADGKVNKQIGASLGLSPLTVKNHLARIRARLGAGDKAQAVAIALRAGLMD